MQMVVVALFSVGVRVFADAAGWSHRAGEDLCVGRTVCSTALSILGWTFNVIDDEDIHGTFSRFQFQTKLLL
jgi:hypothetical protein